MTLNLTSDLVSRNCIESDAYLQYSLRYEFQILCVNASTHNLKVGRLFLAVPQGCLRFVIVVFPDHIHLLFLAIFQVTLMSQSSSYTIFSCKYISTLMVGCNNFKLCRCFDHMM